MRILFLLIMSWIFVVGTTAAAAEGLVEDKDISFVYYPYGFKAVPCEHKRVQDLPDWTVYCQDNYHNKEFSVHLVVKRYRRTEPLGSKYEVLYWVTDRVSPRQREHRGTTMNFIFSGETVAEELRLSQMLGPGGVATLDLKLSL